MEVQKKFSSCWQRLLDCCCARRSKPSEDEPDQKPRRKKDSGSVNSAYQVGPSPVSRRPLPAPPRSQPQKYMALFDYAARTEEDLSFSTGDILEALDKSPGEWWVAKALTGVSAFKQGYIPANYVAPLESIDAEPWYFPDTKRMDAEKMLLAEGNGHGSFLIRNSESQKGELSLSVLDQGKVKHYKLQKLDNGHVFVTMNKSFPTIKELVDYYSKQANGLCARLTEPCKKLQEAPQTYGLSYNTVDAWEIQRTSIELQQKLGAGQFGEVYEALWNGTTTVAVKTLKPGSMDSTDFLREAQIMKKLRHPKLIQLYAVCTTEEPIYIITELMRNGSLLDYLRRDRGTTLCVQDQIEMAAQVAAGMAYLESQNYIHRDLAARNVLVGENNVCKVADFGLARVFMKENENVYEPKEGGKLPVKWTAPEAINENRFTIKSDVWSFGILLYEIMTFGQMPYPGMSNMQTVQWIGKGHRMSCPSNCPTGLHNIMMDCWKENEQGRPTFETLQWQLEDYFEMDGTSYADSARY